MKTEFGKFATILEKAEKQINTVSRSIGDAGKKSRTIERKLRGVEQLSGEESVQLFDDALPAPDEAPDDEPETQA